MENHLAIHYRGLVAAGLGRPAKGVESTHPLLVKTAAAIFRFFLESSYITKRSQEVHMGQTASPCTPSLRCSCRHNNKMQDLTLNLKTPSCPLRQYFSGCVQTSIMSPCLCRYGMHGRAQRHCAGNYTCVLQTMPLYLQPKSSISNRFR